MMHSRAYDFDMETTLETLGQKIRRLRQARGMTQLQLAGLVGVRELALGKWERDQANPSPENLMELARHLGVGPEDLGYRPPSWAPDVAPAWFIQMHEQQRAQIAELTKLVQVLINRR